jgi:hypothetical protein
VTLGRSDFESVLAAAAHTAPWQLPKTPATVEMPIGRRKEVGDSQLRSLAQSVDAKVAHTSAATGQGVAELFQMVAEDLAGSLEAEVRRGGAGSSAVTEPEVVLHRCPPPPSPGQILTQDITSSLRRCSRPSPGNSLFDRKGRL